MNCVFLKTKVLFVHTLNVASLGYLSYNFQVLYHPYPKLFPCLTVVCLCVCVCWQLCIGQVQSRIQSTKIVQLATQSHPKVMWWLQGACQHSHPDHLPCGFQKLAWLPPSRLQVAKSLSMQISKVEGEVQVHLPQIILKPWKDILKRKCNSNNFFHLIKPTIK